MLPRLTTRYIEEEAILKVGSGSEFLLEGISLSLFYWSSPRKLEKGWEEKVAESMGSPNLTRLTPLLLIKDSSSY